jgi:hypothetical protein
MTNPSVKHKIYMHEKSMKDMHGKHASRQKIRKPPKTSRTARTKAKHSRHVKNPSSRPGRSNTRRESSRPARPFEKSSLQPSHARHAVQKKQKKYPRRSLSDQPPVTHRGAPLLPLSRTALAATSLNHRILVLPRIMTPHRTATALPITRRIFNLPRAGLNPARKK